MRVIRPAPVIVAILFCAFGSAETRAASRVDRLLDQSESLRRAGRPADALHILKEANPLIFAEASPLERGRLHLQLARCAYYDASLAGGPQDGNIKEFQAVLREAEILQDEALLADVRDQLGLAIYSRDFRKNGMEEPRRLFEQALDARRKLRDQRGIAESLFHMGLTFENKKDPSPEELRRAVASHEEALFIAGGGGFDIEASYAVRHLAGHKQDGGDLDAALAGFESSLMLRTRAGYHIYLAPALMAIGDVWKDKGNTSKAREFYERALSEADRLGARRFQEAAKEALAAVAAGAGPKAGS
jgi:tetratricopeptide (TPR) repeat protein